MEHIANIVSLNPHSSPIILHLQMRKQRFKEMNSTTQEGQSWDVSQVFLTTQALLLLHVILSPGEFSAHILAAPVLSC